MNFCGLPWDKKCLEFYKRKDMVSKTTSRQQIRKPIYKHKIDRYLPYKKLSIDIAGGYKPDFQLIDDENNLKTVNSIKSLTRKFGKKNVILAKDQDRE